MLGKRITAIRKVILECDPCIVGGDYKKYKAELFDEDLLELDPEDKPTYFKIRQLSDKQKDAIAGETSTRKQAKLAIRCALTGVENYLIQTDTGEKSCASIDFEDHFLCGRIVSQDWLDALNMPTAQMLDLYLCIDHLSEAQLPLSKRSAVLAGDRG